MRREKPAKLRGDLLCLAELGGDPHAVLHGSGVNFADILAQSPLPCDTIAALFDRLARAAPRDFGVICGRAIRSQYLGMLGYRLSNCASIGEVLHEWARYSVIIGYPLDSDFAIEGGCWTMTFRPRYALSRAALGFCAESTLAGFTQSIFNLTGHRIVLEEAALPFPRPTDCAPYAAIEARQVVFDAPFAAVTGRSEDLALQIVTADPDARAVCEAYCRESLSGLMDSEALADRIRATFEAAPGAFPDEVQVSRTLGIGERTMQRKLAAEGTTFHHLLDTCRRERAERLLQQGQSNKMVAHDLGYGDVASFSRAFKRWTGKPPSSWRAGQ